MTSINFKDLYSRFFLKVEAYDLLEPSMTDEMFNEFLCGYIHSTLSVPNVRRLFSSMTITDPHTEEVDNPDYNPHDPQSPSFIEEEVDGSIEFELKTVVNGDEKDTQDEDFVIELIACGMVLAWTEPKTQSLTHMRRMVGTADEKYFAESTFITSMLALREECEIKQSRLIVSRGFINNEYLAGKSASSKLKK